MKKWRYVGIMALLVIGLTANAAIAGPTGATQARSWLRTTAKGDQSPARPTDLSIGKWGAFVLLLGLGGFALWKRRSTSGRMPTVNAATFRIIAATRLSPKAQIVAVEVQGRTLLLGATDTNITRLGWLDEVAGHDTDADEDEDENEKAVRVAETRRGRVERASHSLNDKNATGSEFSRKPSRFRELLADAIGIQPRRVPEKERVPRAPVDELVAATEDRYVGQDVQRNHLQRMRREQANAATLIDVEGQAKGLVARLNRPAT